MKQVIDRIIALAYAANSSALGHATKSIIQADTLLGDVLPASTRDFLRGAVEENFKFEFPWDRDILAFTPQSMAFWIARVLCADMMKKAQVRADELGVPVYIYATHQNPDIPDHYSEAHHTPDYTILTACLPSITQQPHPSFQPRMQEFDYAAHHEGKAMRDITSGIVRVFLDEEGNGLELKLAHGLVYLRSFGTRGASVVLYPMYANQVRVTLDSES